MPDRRPFWTLLILAAAVLGWTLAVEREIGWAATFVVTAAPILLVLIWLRRGGRDFDEPPP